MCCDSTKSVISHFRQKSVFAARLHANVQQERSPAWSGQWLVLYNRNTNTSLHSQQKSASRKKWKNYILMEEVTKKWPTWRVLRDNLVWIVVYLQNSFNEVLWQEQQLFYLNIKYVRTFVQKCTYWLIDRMLWEGLTTPSRHWIRENSDPFSYFVFSSVV